MTRPAMTRVYKCVERSGDEIEIEIDCAIWWDDYGVRGSPRWAECEVRDMREVLTGAAISWEAFLEGHALWASEDPRAKGWELRVLEEIQEDAITSYDPDDGGH